MAIHLGSLLTDLTHPGQPEPMDKAGLDLFTDCLLSARGFATAAGMSAMIDAAVSHDKATRFLPVQQYE